MDSTKLFETQAILDEKIMQQHPELCEQENLNWKILALQVELAECANEWRGFKKWSKNQEPRTKVFTWINGKGERVESKYDPHMLVENIELKEFKVINPLLEEYVDCLHFILSIGLEKIDYHQCQFEIRKIAPMSFAEGPINDVCIISQFNSLFLDIGALYDAAVDKTFDYQPVNVVYSNVWRSFVGLGEMLGFTWSQIEAAYYAKNEINHERQLAGY